MKTAFSRAVVSAVQELEQCETGCPNEAEIMYLLVLIKGCCEDPDMADHLPMILRGVAGQRRRIRRRSDSAGRQA